MKDLVKRKELFKALLRLKTLSDYRCFFDDLCTPAELVALADRWQVAKLIKKEIPYRKIHDMTGVSTATVTRVARSLTYGKGYQRALELSEEERK